MAKIVLDSEPKGVRDCPFGEFKKCYLTGVSCKAIRKTPDEHGRMVERK